MFDDAEERVRQILAETAGIDINLIQKGSRFEDWGADELKLLEALFQVESRFGISAASQQTDRVSDFDGLMRMVRRQIDINQSGAA